MSILIKGMEMPTTCAKCPLGHINAKRYAIECYAEYHTKLFDYDLARHSTNPFCPLITVPPHGRLIEEADAIKTVWMILNGLGYLKEENPQLEQTVREVFATAPAIEVE